jgi:hypothetical protein
LLRTLSQSGGEIVTSVEETNARRVLGIVGSPRRGGNTEILVDEVLRGAEEAGAQVDKVILSKLDIAPCRACDTCGKTGVCVQRDDMLPLLEQMARSQVWVLGTPVYWWGPTAQLKVFIDRWYGGRHAILTVPLEDRDARTARHTVGMFEDILDYLKMELFATVLAPGVLHRGEVREHPDILAEARRVGREAIETQQVC